jgi:hypothetical protein
MLNFNLEEELSKDANLEAIVSNLISLPRTMEPNYLNKLGFRELKLNYTKQDDNDRDRVFGYKNFKVIVDSMTITSLKNGQEYYIIKQFYKAR